jgi:hypothetical protein
MKRIPWRSLLVWAVPLLAFAWLAVAGRAASGRPAMPPGSSLVGGGAQASQFGLSTAAGTWRVKVDVRDPARKRPLGPG